MYKKKSTVIYYKGCIILYPTMSEQKMWQRAQQLPDKYPRSALHSLKAKAAAAKAAAAAASSIAVAAAAYAKKLATAAVAFAKATGVLLDAYAALHGLERKKRKNKTLA